jgi:TorA maturation chaperone TorD
MAIDAAHNASAENDEVGPEERARAAVYALIGSLFYQAPSPDLLRAIATGQTLCNDGSDSGFCQAWRALQHAAASAEAGALKEEFERAFISTGRPAVMLFGSFYLAGFLNEKPLAQLRDELAKMGLARRGDCHDSEDHISALCDVMRLLIVGDDGGAPAALEAQRDFFVRYIKSWNTPFCDAVNSANETSFYKHVARFAREFFDLEYESFAIV